MEEKQYSVGINVLGGAGLSQAQHIALIAEAGWDAFFTGWDPDRIGKWADAGARAGLTYASVHAPFGEVNRMWEAGDAAEHVRNDLVACATDCGRYGIPVMVLHPFIGFRDHTPNRIGIDNFRRVVEAAFGFFPRLFAEQIILNYRVKFAVQRAFPLLFANDGGGLGDTGAVREQNRSRADAFQAFSHVNPPLPRE